MKPTVPQSPLGIIVRGGLIWYHGSLALGSLWSVKKDEPYALSLLPLNAGICTIGGFLGMRILWRMFS